MRRRHSRRSESSSSNGTMHTDWFREIAHVDSNDRSDKRRHFPLLRPSQDFANRRQDHETKHYIRRLKQIRQKCRHRRRRDEALSSDYSSISSSSSSSSNSNNSKQSNDSRGSNQDDNDSSSDNSTSQDSAPFYLADILSPSTDEEDNVVARDENSTVSEQDTEKSDTDDEFYDLTVDDVLYTVESKLDDQFDSLFTSSWAWCGNVQDKNKEIPTKSSNKSTREHDKQQNNDNNYLCGELLTAEDDFNDVSTAGGDQISDSPNACYDCNTDTRVTSIVLQHTFEGASLEGGSFEDTLTTTDVNTASFVDEKEDCSIISEYNNNINKKTEHDDMADTSKQHYEVDFDGRNSTVLSRQGIDSGNIVSIIKQYRKSSGHKGHKGLISWIKRVAKYKNKQEPSKQAPKKVNKPVSFHYPSFSRDEDDDDSGVVAASPSRTSPRLRTTLSLFTEHLSKVNCGAKQRPAYEEEEDIFGGLESFGTPMQDCKTTAAKICEQSSVASSTTSNTKSTNVATPPRDGHISQEYAEYMQNSPRHNRWAKKLTKLRCQSHGTDMNDIDRAFDTKTFATVQEGIVSETSSLFKEPSVSSQRPPRFPKIWCQKPMTRNASNNSDPFIQQSLVSEHNYFDIPRQVSYDARQDDDDDVSMRPFQLVHDRETLGEDGNSNVLTIRMKLVQDDL